MCAARVGNLLPCLTPVSLVLLASDINMQDGIIKFFSFFNLYSHVIIFF